MRTSRGMPLWPIPRPPGSRTRSVRACQGLRPRRVEPALALSRRLMLPSAHKMNVGTREASFSRFNGWPTRSPVNASRTASRPPAHDSGPMWIATPSLRWTCTIYSLPVSRRTFVPTPPVGRHHSAYRRQVRAARSVKHPHRPSQTVPRDVRRTRQHSTRRGSCSCLLRIGVKGPKGSASLLGVVVRKVNGTVKLMPDGQSWGGRSCQVDPSYQLRAVPVA